MNTIQPRLIVGLGNPGDEYRHTRHNIGFMVIDRVLARLPQKTLTTLHAHESWLGTVPWQGGVLALQKPLTYMNLSGSAVAGACRRLQVSPAEVLIVYDDVDLPLGRLRVRRRGSSGGHRGVESIIEQLSTSQFNRLRLGIGRGNEKMVDYVLARFDEDEQELLDQVLNAAVDAVMCSVRRGIDVAMNEYNGLSLERSTDNRETGASDD